MPKKTKIDKTIYFIIETELYSELIHVFANCTYQVANNMIKKLYPKLKYIPFDFDNEDGKYSVGGLAEITDKENTMRHFAFWMEDAKDIDCLVHETHHLTNQIILDKGIEISLANDEPSAYFQAYLVSKIMEGIKEAKKK